MEIQPRTLEVHGHFVRRKCRNPRCGARLKQETSNARAAFCCADCHERHFKKVCLVCERPLRCKGGRPRRFCSKRCQSEFHRDPGRFPPAWTPTLQARRNPHGSAHSTGTKIGTKRGRPPRIVAGPGANLDPINLAVDAATFAHVRRLNHRHWNEATLIGPRDWPIDLVGGGDFQRGLPTKKFKRGTAA